ncbi:uncharacterized protein [Diadema antillarum]|uniref:uncharacterized protein n=1 Tax=Diadema antillarum TaxID=105358 RepID=UPI003A840F27
MSREDKPKMLRLFEETLTKDQLNDLIHSRKKPSHWEDGVVSYFRVYKIIQMLREENKPCTPHLVTAIDVLSDGKSKIRNQSTYDFCKYVKFQVEDHVDRTDEELQQQVERLMPGCLPIGPECESLGITGDILFDEEKYFKEPIPRDRITNRVMYELSQFLPRVLENQQSMAKWLKKILHLRDDHVPSVDLITKWCSVLHKETSRKRRSSMSQAQQYLEEKFSFTDFKFEDPQKETSEKTDADVNEPAPQDEQDQPMQVSAEGDSSATAKAGDEPMEADFSGNENGSAETVTGIIAEALDILDEGECQKEQDVSGEKLSQTAVVDKDSDLQVGDITRQDGDNSAAVTCDDSTHEQNEEELSATTKDKSGAEHLFPKSPKSAARMSTFDESKDSGRVSKVKSDSKKIAKKDVPKPSSKGSKKAALGRNRKKSSNIGCDDSDNDEISDKDEVTSMTGRKPANGALDRATLHKNLAKANRIIKTVLRVVSRLKKEMHVTMNYLETEASKLCDDLKHEQERLEKAKRLIDNSSVSEGEETEEEDADDSTEKNTRASGNKRRSSKNTKMITVQVKPGVKDTLRKSLVRLRPLPCQRDGDGSDISDLHDSASSSDSDMKSKMSRAERKVMAHTKLVKESSPRKGVSSARSRSKPKVTRNRNAVESSASAQCSSTAELQKPTGLKCESGESPGNDVNDFDKAKLFSSRVCVSLTKLNQKQIEKAERRNNEMIEVEESEDDSSSRKSSRQRAVQKSRSRAKRLEKAPESDSETEPSEEEEEEEEDMPWTPAKSAKSTHTDTDSSEDHSKGTTARKSSRITRIPPGKNKSQKNKAGEKETRKAAASKGSRSRTSRNAGLYDKDAESSEENCSDEQKKTRSASSKCEEVSKGDRQQRNKQSSSEPPPSKEKPKKRSLDDFVKALNSPKRIKMGTEKKMPSMNARGRRCKDIQIVEDSPTNEDDSDYEDNEDDDFLEKATEQELQRLKEGEIGNRSQGMQKEAGIEGTLVNGEQNASVKTTDDVKTNKPESSNVSQMDTEVDVCPPLIENQVDKKSSDSVREIASSDSCTETKVNRGKEGMMGSEQVVKANCAESGFDPPIEVEGAENPLLNEIQEEERNIVEVASKSDSDTGKNVNGEQENMSSVEVVDTKYSEPSPDPQMDTEVDTSLLSVGKQIEEDKTDADTRDGERKDPESSLDSQIEMEIDESLISNEKQELVVSNSKDKLKGDMNDGSNHRVNGQIKEGEDVRKMDVLEGGDNNCDYHGLEEDSGSIESKGEEGQESAESSLGKATGHSESEESPVQQSQNISSHRKAENGTSQRKKKAKNERGKNNKVSKPAFPGDSIIGKQVRHRSSLGHPDIFKWYKGKVLRKSTASELLKLGQEHIQHLNNLVTIFAVKYEEYTDVSHEALEVAWRKGDLKIVP